MLPFLRILFPLSKILSRNSSNSLSSDSATDERLNPFDFDPVAVAVWLTILSCVSSSPSAKPSSFPNVADDVLVLATGGNSSLDCLGNDVDPSSVEVEGSKESSGTDGSRVVTFFGNNLSAGSLKTNC